MCGCRELGEWGWGGRSHFIKRQQEVTEPFRVGITLVVTQILNVIK